MSDQTITPLHRGPVLVASNPSPTERVRLAHKAVEQAATDLHAGQPGSGVRALVFAAATHLSLTVGPDAAEECFLRALANIKPSPEAA
ncbi:hypothetical protein [Brevundimonas vesicularis]|uniref:hypothetical protein n=1 Tax=Brevundimonas vesicularis TaxID=41276 RepID=UPI0011B020E5|nr:hypothetical protein [Brevundimonas vesicularis]